jgi:pectin methylesterase-like acyl-CoA thioesterase
MKLRHTLLFVILLAAILMTQMAWAQSASATWPLTNPTASGTGQAVQVSGQLVGFDEKFVNMEVNGYTGGNNSQRIRMAGTGNTWPANQTTQIDTVYTQFAVEPLASYKVRIDSVVIRIGAASTNNMKANLYYSTDTTWTTKQPVAFTTSSTTAPAGTFLLSGGLDTVRFAPNVTLNEKDRFLVRLYPWMDNQASAPTGKYMCLQNIVIYATAIAIPVPASAVWPLMTNETPIISGLINAGALAYGGGLYKYGFNANGDRWTIDNGPNGKGSWPAEASANFTRYAQFSIGPQTGGTFYSDSLKFTQIVEFTTTLRLAIYYAKDTTFASKKFLADTTVPAGKTTYAYALRDSALTGQAIYVRFYPYDTAQDPAWKLVDVSNVIVSGSTTGLAILLPTVTTVGASYVSTTSAVAGGTVTADGGGSVTARGVCWNVAGDPTIADGHTTDGSGIGTFTSSIKSLTAGQTYHLRAYATNVSGTAYGTDIPFTTLAAIVPPTLTTTVPSSIMVKTALSGGNVTAWGGDSVKARGVCWGTTLNPTIATSKTSDGIGLGAFTSGMTGLTANTLYHVRAYATNSAGTGYGSDTTFTTQVQQRDTTVIVAKDGSGNYTTVQAAFRAVPMNYTGRWTILVKRGKYYEKDTLATGKVNVVLQGEDRDSTVIWYDDYADRYGSGNPGTSGTYTMTIDASDFIAKNITIQNTYAPQAGVSGTQAVAVSANGDRQEYINVKLLGYQDTYYTRGSVATGRTYHKKCYIEGTVDFIFGRNVAVFDSCTIRELRNGGTLTAASTESGSLFGYVFRNCTILADSVGYDGVKITSFTLGRPWQASPRTVFINSSEPWNLAPAGWTAWNVTPALYAEYNCFGPGAAPSSRVSWSSQLSKAAAATYSLSNMFAKNSTASSLVSYDWVPTSTTAADELPFTLTGVEQTGSMEVPSTMSLRNYPNPFNPETKIQFSVTTRGMASVKVYNLLGQEVARVFEGLVEPGKYYITHFDATRLASGMYVYTLQINNLHLAEKMMLLR